MNPVANPWQKIYDEFLDMFRLKYADPPFHPITFGIGCGVGWYDLIHETLKKLHEYDPHIEIVQIKEKFARLRVSLDVNPSCMCEHRDGDTPLDIILAAEEKSGKICEICGAKGKLRDDLAWIRTLCTKHYRETKRRKKRVAG